MDKLDKTLVSTLAAEGNALAVVRVRNAWQLDRIERHFEVLARFPFINSVGLRCDGREATRLAAMQEVVSVTAQSRVRALDVGGNGLPTGAECFSAPGAGRLTGRGVRLCVMDTGVSPHTDVSVPRDRIGEFHEMVAGGESPYDDDGLGTFVTGVAVKGLDAGGTYALMSGTSVSAPYVAGACCLLHEKYRALSPREAKRMIIASARVTDGVRVFRL